MKANEAPEKIYIQKRSSYNNILEYDSEWTPIPFINEDNIEYTRTDAFIDKACEWLKENKDHPFIGCEDPCLSGYLTDGFIEAFKKAMEE